MARRPAQRLLLLAAAAVGLLLCRPGSLAQVGAGKEDEGPLAQLPAEVSKMARFWEQPHRVRCSHGGVGLTSISQGGDSYQLSVSEEGDPDKAGVFLSKTGEGAPQYGFEYDSRKSQYSIADAAGLKLKRVALSAATQPGEQASADWTLHVEGDKGRRFSVTGDGESVVYDGAFGIEVPVVEGVALRYAFDAKRRAGSSAVPSWFRHSMGLRYASPAGDVKLRVHQPDPDFEDAPLEYAASLQGEITGPNVKGSPTYTLKATRDASESASYSANMKVKGSDGFSGVLTAAIRGGKSAISASGEYAKNHSVAKGIQVGGDARVTLSPPSSEEGEEVLSLHPIGLEASADLSELAPGIAGPDSTLNVRTRYRLGADRPTISASAKLNAKDLAALQLAAEASVDDQGSSSGKVQVSGTANGVAARYEAESKDGGSPRHAAEVLYPAEVGKGGARAFGRLFQGGTEGDKPRLQLGVQYDFDTDVAGKSVRVQGDSALFDSGDSLLGENGLPWRDTRLNRIRQSAAVVRRRVEGSGIQSFKWLDD